MLFIREKCTERKWLYPRRAQVNVRIFRSFTIQGNYEGAFLHFIM